MLHLTLESLTELLFNFLFYFMIGSFGAFLKDLHETLTKKNEQIRLSEVLIGGACATFICLALRDWSWFATKSIGFMALMTFMLGILGFEIFGNITTISRLKDFIRLVYQLKSTPPSEWTDTSMRQSIEGDEKKSDIVLPEPPQEEEQVPTPRMATVHVIAKKKGDTN